MQQARSPFEKDATLFCGRISSSSIFYWIRCFSFFLRGTTYCPFPGEEAGNFPPMRLLRSPSLSSSDEKVGEDFSGYDTWFFFSSCRKVSSRAVPPSKIF